MKTIRLLLLLSFLSSPIFIFSNFRPLKNQSLQLRLEADAARNRLQVVVHQQQATRLTLRITDESNGRLVHEETLPAGFSTVQTRMKLDALANGRYRVAVNDGRREQSGLVELATDKRPAHNRQIMVWPIE